MPGVLFIFQLHRFIEFVKPIRSGDLEHNFCSAYVEGGSFREKYAEVYIVGVENSFKATE